MVTQSVPTKFITTNNKNHLSSKLKTKFTTINTAEPATTTTTTPSSLATSSLATFASDNTIAQKQSNAKSPVSIALRRKFHPRRLITTTASSASATDESATEPPRTQNPLFKRRFSLTYTISATTTSTTPRPKLNEDLALQTATALYAEPEDATDQVAKSSIHTSRFNQNAAAEEDNEEVSAIKVLPKVQSTLNGKLKASAAAVGNDDEVTDGGIGVGEAITRRMDNTAGEYGTRATTTTTATSAPIPSRRASASASAANKRRPQKANASTSATPNAASTTTRATRHRHRYVRVEPLDRLNQHAASSAKRSGQRGYQTNFDYDYYDEGEETPRRQVGGSSNGNGSRKSKKGQQLKVILHGRGIIECLDQGNFPHPLSCRKFISCAKFETGGVVGWEYTCPKGLRYDPASGMCTWANGVDCRD